MDRDGPPPSFGSCMLHGNSVEVPDDDEDSKDFSPGLDSPGGLPSSPGIGSPGGSGSPRLPSRGNTPPFDHSNCSATMHKSCVCVNFIEEHTMTKKGAMKV